MTKVFNLTAWHKLLLEVVNVGREPSIALHLPLLTSGLGFWERSLVVFTTKVKKRRQLVYGQWLFHKG